MSEEQIEEQWKINEQGIIELRNAHSKDDSSNKDVQQQIEQEPIVEPPTEETTHHQSHDKKVVGQHIQDGFLNLSIMDTEFLEKYKKIIPVCYFSSQVTKDLIKLCYDYHEQFKEAPVQHMEDEMIQFLKGTDEEMKDGYYGYLKRIQQMEEPNPDYIADRVSKFVRARAMETCLIEARPYVERGNFDKAKEIILQATEIGVIQDDLVYSSQQTLELADFLCEKHFMLGHLNMITGEGDMGKSTLLAYFAAIITGGLDWPSGERQEAQDVVYLTSEDEAWMVRARVTAMGGNTNRLIIIDRVENQDEQKVIQFPGQTTYLDSVLSQCNNPGALMIDSLGCYIDTKKSSNCAEDTRSIGGSIIHLCRKYNIAGFPIRHFGKNAEYKAANKMLGSTEWRNNCRMVWQLTQADEDDYRNFVPSKANRVNKREPGLSWQFRIDAIEIPNPNKPGTMIDVSRVTFLKTLTMTADDACRVADPKNRAKWRQKDDIRSYLQEALREGPVLVTELDENMRNYCAMEDVTISLFAGVRNDMHIKSYRSSTRPGEGGGCWQYDFIERHSACNE